MPYVTGGLGEDWLDIVRAVAAAGADAVEIGIPFSDPVMDGPVIQAASQRALEAGATPVGIIDALRGAEVDVPLAVMTYYNLVARAGYRRMAFTLAVLGRRGRHPAGPARRRGRGVGRRGRRRRGRDGAPGRPDHPRRPVGAHLCP